MRYGLTEDIIEKIIEIFTKYPKIKKVILYGSRAKGNYKKGSDIDLTLKGEDLQIKDLLKVDLELDELYLPYAIDLSIFEKIQNKDLIEHINRIGIVIYEKRESDSIK